MQTLKHTAAMQVVILFACVVAAWSVELVDRVAFGGSLEHFGIHPGDVAGLWGILAAPLLHAGWLHLAANTGPFLVLGWFGFLGGVVAARLLVSRRQPQPAYTPV